MSAEEPEAAPPSSRDEHHDPQAWGLPQLEAAALPLAAELARRFLRLATEFLVLLILAASALIVAELLVPAPIWHAIPR